MIRAWWDRLLVLLLSVLGLYPFARGLLRGEIPGQRETPIDGAHTLYVYEYVRLALAGQASLAHADATWFPVGRPFLLGVQNVVDAVLAAPLLALFGPGGGLALFTAFLLVANGLAAGWLGERVAGRGWPGPVAAAVVAFSPFVWCETNVGRTTQVALLPMVLAVGLAWTAAGGRQALLTGLALSLAALEYWFYGFFGAVLVGAVYVGVLVSRPNLSTVRDLAVTAVVPALVVLPFAVYVASTWAEMPGLGNTSPVPNATRLAGGMPWSKGLKMVLYVPQLLVVPALLAVLAPGRARALGLALGALFLVGVAVGEHYTLLGVTFPTPLALLRELPAFERFWWPHRALAGVTVALAALAATTAALGGWRRWTTLACVLASTVQVTVRPGELGSWSAPPRPTWDASLPAGAVLTLPMLDPDAGKLFLAEWAEHHRPMVNGMSMWDEFLWPADYRDWVATQPLVEALLDLERSRHHGRRTPTSHGRDKPPDGATPPSRESAAAVARADALSLADVARLADEGVVGIVARVDRAHPEARRTLDRLLGPATEGDKSCWWRLR